MNDLPQNIMFVGSVVGKCKAGYDGSTYDSEGICPSLMTTIITGSKLYIYWLEKMIQETHKVIRLGNCSTGDSEGGMCYSIQGISQTITAGTHGYGMGNIVVIDGNECKETC